MRPARRHDEQRDRRRLRDGDPGRTRARGGQHHARDGDAHQRREPPDALHAVVAHADALHERQERAQQQEHCAGHDAQPLAVQHPDTGGERRDGHGQRRCHMRCRNRQHLRDYDLHASRRADSMDGMDMGLRPLSEVLDSADATLRRGESAAGRAWATGFDPLDSYLGGGVRSGELVLVGGPQGFGKTTWVLQALRNMVAGGAYGVYVSYEHDEYTVLERLLALEAGLLYGAEAVGMRRIRAALEAVDGRGHEPLEERLADTPGGTEALQLVRTYAHASTSPGRTAPRRACARSLPGPRRSSRSTGQAPVIVVDYLQKVPVPGGPDIEEERITLVAEGLKDLALRLQRPDRRRRRRRAGGPRRRQAAARAQPARVLRVGLRARRHPAHERQVRRGRPPPPGLRHRQRRPLQELGRDDASRRTGPAWTRSTSSSSSTSIRGGSTPRARSSPSSSSTSASTSSSGSPAARRGRSVGPIGVVTHRPRQVAHLESVPQQTAGVVECGVRPGQVVLAEPRRSRARAGRGTAPR